jgi:hypothetical protein
VIEKLYLRNFSAGSTIFPIIHSTDLIVITPCSQHQVTPAVLSTLLISLSLSSAECSPFLFSHALHKKSCHSNCISSMVKKIFWIKRPIY